MRNSRLGIKQNPKLYEKKHCKPVLQYDMNMNLIAEHRSIRDAEKSNEMVGLTKAVNGGYKDRNPHSKNGFIWKFKN